MPETTLFSPEFLRDPYPLYRTLRASDPVHEFAPGAWMLTRYHDVRQILADPAYLHWTSQPSAAGQPQSALARWVRLMDPRNGSALRKLVLELFSPAALQELQRFIECETETLLDQIERSNSADAVLDVAAPLASAVILRLMGLSTGDHALYLSAGKMLFAHCMSGEGLVDDGPVAQLQRAVLTAMETETDVSHPTILGAVRRASQLGEAVDAEDVIAFTAIFLYAGSENIMNFLGNSILALSLRPEQWELLFANSRLLHSAVEELMRFESPVQCVNLALASDRELGGRKLAAGDTVLASIAAANRDPSVFDNPDSLDIARNVNPHLSFGTGAMYCIGAELARMEARVLLRSLTNRFKPFQLQNSELRWRSHPHVLRGLESLEVGVTPWNTPIEHLPRTMTR